MTQAPKRRERTSTLYLCAPVNALVEGIYEEHIPLSQVKEHGDLGLGTFDHLDGEMVMLDGRAYQITADGKVHEVGDEALTPFACVTKFHADRRLSHEGIMLHKDFMAWLKSRLPSLNICYAFRIDGLFKHLKLRSVPKQESYRPLVEVAKSQVIFEFDAIEGTLVGFYTPDFMASLNVPDFHLHFLSHDHEHGGHMLECIPERVQIGIQILSHVELSLPLTQDYLQGDFQRSVQEDLNQVEK